MNPAGKDGFPWAWFFWAGALFVGYTYFFYPLLIALLARCRPRPRVHRCAES